MISRRLNSKDTLSDTNSNIRFLSILVKFCESPNLKNFAGINFQESTGGQKGNLFSRKFLPLRYVLYFNYIKISYSIIIMII